MEPASGEQAVAQAAESEAVTEPKSELEKWVGEGKQYTPPVVTAAMVTPELFEIVCLLPYHDTS
jgi:hypothetical protein